MLKSQVGAVVLDQGNKVALRRARRVPSILQQFPYPPAEDPSTIRLVRLEMLQDGLRGVFRKDSDGNYVATFAGASPGITGLGRHAS